MKNKITYSVLMCSFLIVIEVLGGGVSAQQKPNGRNAQTASRQETLTIFSQLEPRLQHESGVPPRLPHFLPFMHKSHPIHAILQSVSASGYSILLANALPCEGANWCLYGSVKGSAQPFSQEGKAGRGVPMILQGGIKATFYDSECDAYCAQAYVEWQEEEYYYSVGIKGPNPMREILIKVANSAVKPSIRH